MELPIGGLTRYVDDSSCLRIGLTGLSEKYRHNRLTVLFLHLLLPVGLLPRVPMAKSKT